MQRIRKGLEVLAAQGELEHALASKQIVFHDVIEAYLARISFGDAWATELIVPVTEHPILRVRPNVAGGDPLFMEGGAPLFSCTRSIRSRGVDPIDCS